MIDVVLLNAMKQGIIGILPGIAWDQFTQAVFRKCQGCRDKFFLTFLQPFYRLAP